MPLRIASQGKTWRYGVVGGIPRTNLLAEYRLDEGTGQWVYNRAAAATPQVDFFAPLIPETMGGFSYSASYGVTDPDGGTAAIHITSSANARASQAITLAAGTYTLSVWAQSDTGANQDFRLTIDGGNYVTCTATPTWQRFSVTQTVAASTGDRVFYQSQSSNVALGLNIYAPKLESGSTMTPVIPPRLDLALGLTAGADSADPTWVSGGLHFSGTAQMAAGSNAIVTGLTNVTVYALARWTDNAVTLAARESSLIGESNTNILNILGSGGSANPWPSARQNGTASFVEAKNVPINDGAWHLLTYSYDGGTQRLYWNGYDFSERGRAFVSVSLRKLYLGGRYSSGNTWPGDIAYTSVYTTAHTDAQVRATVAEIYKAVAPRGIARTVVSKMVVVEGDSITAGWDQTGGGYSYYAIPNITPRPPCANRAIPGSRIQSPQQDLVSRAASIDALYDATRTRNILTVLAGTNDIAADGDNANTVYAQLKAYCQARQAVGWKVLVGTLLPSTNNANAPGGSFNAVRNSANTLIRNAVTEGWASGIFDFAADATMGPDAAASNTTYYPDGLHPAPSAHQTYLAPIWQAAVAAALA